MNSDKTIYNSRILKCNVLAIVIFTNLFLSVACSHAWEKAIWPFNTPYMVSKQICKNSKDWARAAYHCYDQQSRAELLSDLYEKKRADIKDDPKYRAWHIIYYREMERYVKIVWKNPNITENMAIEIIQDRCNSGRIDIKKQLEETNPKK
jgi:hypothetical protein